MTTERVALVTGGSRGIGRAICTQLAKQGIGLAINYAGNDQLAQETADACQALGVQTLLLKGDVSNAKVCEEMVQQVLDTFGRLDILVNNAGITRDNLALRMRQRGGRIINVSSIVGLRGNAGQANYAASKAGLIGMSKSLAKELAARNVTVNVVAPGFIQTDMTDVLADKVREALLGSIPMKRLGQPEDVAKAVAFLASEDAAYITGQVLCIDGGMAM